MFALIRACQSYDVLLLAVGDRKSPFSEWPGGSEFLSLDAQRQMNSKLAGLLPVDHYSRKNLGYLEAIARGCNASL